MSTWHWVRHGPTHQKTMTGWRDVPADLSDVAQLARVSDALPQNALIVSSDLLRARQTADSIGDARERLPNEPGLREFHFGAWDGLDFTQITARSPTLSRAYWERPGDIAPPGGESWNESAQRVATTVRALMRAHPGRDIVAVAHFGVILTQIQAAQKCPAADVLAHKIDPLSITSIKWGATSARVLCINHHP